MILKDIIDAYFVRRFFRYDYFNCNSFLRDMGIGEPYYRNLFKTYSDSMAKTRAYMRKIEAQKTDKLVNVGAEKFRKEILGEMTFREAAILARIVSKLWDKGMWLRLDLSRREEIQNTVKQLFVQVLDRVDQNAKIVIEAEQKKIAALISSVASEVKEITQQVVKAVEFTDKRAVKISSLATAIMAENPTYKARYRRLMMVLKDADKLPAEMKKEVLDVAEEKVKNHYDLYKNRINVSENEMHRISKEVALDLMRGI